MSAIVVCGKRSFFEDHPSSPQSPPSSKRLRCSSSTSPVRLTPFTNSQALVDQLKALFPDMDNQVLSRALDESDGDMNAAIERLRGLNLGNTTANFESAPELDTNMKKGTAAAHGDAPPPSVSSTQDHLQMGGTEWVELLVSEMMSASSIDDARSRAASVLESLEKSITARSAQNNYEENMMLKEQIEVLFKENSILKRAVAIQHERQKEYDVRDQEVQQLKQLLTQYQEKLRTLEVNNYALKMHLQQAQQSNNIPGRFNPDVF